MQEKANCSCACLGRDHEFPREVREAAIHRYVADGEPLAVIGIRLGLPRSCVSGWYRDWEYRRGMWQDQPLTAAELARGWTIDDWTRDRAVTRYHVNAKHKPSKKQPKNTFLMKLTTTTKQLDLDEVRTAYLDLSTDEQARYTTVFDAMVEAIELAGVAVLKRRKAAEMAAMALQDEAA